MGNAREQSEDQVWSISHLSWMGSQRFRLERLKVVSEAKIFETDGCVCYSLIRKQKYRFSLKKIEKDREKRNRVKEKEKMQLIISVFEYIHVK